MRRMGNVPSAEIELTDARTASARIQGTSREDGDGGRCGRTGLWCPRSESNRHAFKGGGFSYHFGFRHPRAGSSARVRGLEHAFTVAVRP